MTARAYVRPEAGSQLLRRLNPKLKTLNRVHGSETCSSETLTSSRAILRKPLAARAPEVRGLDFGVYSPLLGRGLQVYGGTLSLKPVANGLYITRVSCIAQGSTFGPSFS